MYIGKTIRTIRVNKNIPSNKVYKNILSRPAISKFEKGLADTTVCKFFNILNNLNITLEEFEVYYLQKENTNTYYTNNYIDAYYNKNILKLNYLIQKAQIEYNNTGDEKFNHYKAVMTLLLFDLDNTIDYKDSIYILQKYLMNCNVWGYYEVTLFTNTLSYYSNDLIDLVYSRAIKIFQSSPNTNRYRNEFAFLICNILEVKILSKNISSANFYLLELQKQEKRNQDHMYLRTITKYFIAIINFITNKENDNPIIRILDIFNFLDLQNEKIIYEDFYLKVKNLYLL